MTDPNSKFSNENCNLPRNINKSPARRSVAGIAWLVGGFCTAGTSDATAKWLSESHSEMQIVCMRAALLVSCLGTFLAWCYTQCTVQPNHFTIEHRVLSDITYPFGCTLPDCQGVTEIAQLPRATFVLLAAVCSIAVSGKGRPLLLSVFVGAFIILIANVINLRAESKLASTSPL